MKNIIKGKVVCPKCYVPIEHVVVWSKLEKKTDVSYDAKEKSFSYEDTGDKEETDEIFCVVCDNQIESFGTVDEILTGNVEMHEMTRAEALKALGRSDAQECTWVELVELNHLIGNDQHPVEDTPSQQIAENSLEDN